MTPPGTNRSEALGEAHRYRLDEWIATGAMGEVWRATAGEKTDDPEPPDDGEPDEGSDDGTEGKSKPGERDSDESKGKPKGTKQR